MGFTIYWLVSPCRVNERFHLDISEKWDIFSETLQCSMNNTFIYLIRNSTVCLPFELVDVFHWIQIIFSLLFVSDMFRL